MLSRRLLRIKVVKALFAHLKSGADNMIASEKTLMTSVDKAYDLYFQILILPVEIARYAEQRQELAKQKKLPTHEDLNPNTKFVDNQIIRIIANSDAVNDYAAARKLNWTRYPELIRTLYTQLTEIDSYQDYIEKFTSNWDVERIVFMDNLIIGTAMAELTSFPSIPVKVTLDEYIEISKYYSTPGSSTFINGVLDKIVDSLTAEGRIKKAGRGLI